ncbi:flagella synthesis protein FlgN [Marinobacter bohaiensis]|uniref:flagella synthesis protein FlgN n=1 Tax=Marinobacter bohaiensis TaxID=2201898 RepID=UPI000DAD9721|nr:flagellar protein FlgN [Marinobacter bohaiensis]
MAAIDELKKLLREDIKQLEQLGGVLASEKSLLKSSDVDGLESVTQEKNRLLASVRERAKQKIHVLVQMGFNPRNGQPSTFIRSAGIEELTTLWQDAENRLKACQRLNQVNGRIIGHLQQRLGRLNEIFRGCSDQAKLYSSSGQSSAVSHKTVLASA